MSDKGSLYYLTPNQISPPQDVWDKIAISLDEDAQAVSLTQHSPTNPLHSQQVAVDSLQVLPTPESMGSTTLASMLADCVQTPPAAIWQHIQQELDADATKVIPIHKGFNKSWFMWATTIAAAFVGVTFMVYPLLKSRKQVKLFASSISSLVLPAKVDSKLAPGDFPVPTALFIPAIGPHGNPVNVSPKLLPMIEFFNEVDAKQKPASTQITPAQKIWHNKLLAWQAIVDSVTNNPAANNLVNPIELMQFLQQQR